MPSLNAKQIISWWERHGGLAAIHVRPVGEGWALTHVCKDGARLTTTADQDRAIERELEKFDA